MPDRTRVGVLGAAGRMGQAVCHAVEGDPTLRLTARIDHRTGDEVDWDGIDALSNVDVAVDFTHPDAVMGNLREAVARGVSVVVGTTASAREFGVTAGSLVRDAARALGGGGGGKDDLAQGGGSDPAAIGDALDLTPSAVGGLINELRALGVAVPYRHPPTSAAQMARRLRRRRQARRGPGARAVNTAPPPDRPESRAPQGRPA